MDTEDVFEEWVQANMDLNLFNCKLKHYCLLLIIRVLLTRFFPSLRCSCFVLLLVLLMFFPRLLSFLAAPTRGSSHCDASLLSMHISSRIPCFSLWDALDLFTWAIFFIFAWTFLSPLNAEFVCLGSEQHSLGSPRSSYSQRSLVTMCSIWERAFGQAELCPPVSARLLAAVVTVGGRLWREILPQMCKDFSLSVCVQFSL